MRGKCPKCGAVFDIKPMPSLIHVGPWRYTKCPACGKSSMMNNFVKDPITWPPEAKEEASQPALTEEELKQKRLDESKYEGTDDSSP
jgi:predicted  nucleic acid-binding Zn-ribbon protein